MLRRMEMPMTATGQHLVLPEDVEKNALVLYRENSSNLTFAGLYNPNVPDENYKDGIVAVPLRSTFLRIHSFLGGENIWNVQGSSDDNVYVDTTGVLGGVTDISWVGIWRIVTGNIFASRCYVHGPGTNVNTNIVGGHMMLTPSSVLPVGADVYLLPICKTHNHYTNTGVMTVDSAVNAVVMKYKVN